MRPAFPVLFWRVLALCIACNPLFLFAQPPRYVELMQDPEAQFSETVEAFEEYWRGRPVTRGSGWKPFKRWEYYMENRIAPDGSQMAPQ
ncbi:MAG: hypothetical protein AAFQ68_14665, partial [Bacteroidota bacterium]